MRLEGKVKRTVTENNKLRDPPCRSDSYQKGSLPHQQTQATRGAWSSAVRPSGDPTTAGAISHEDKDGVNLEGIASKVGDRKLNCH